MFLMCCRRRAASDDEGVSLGSAGPGANPELKGITLNTQVPKLTDEQKRNRDLALAKYRRRLEREERRRRKEAERAAREQARLERMRAVLDDPNGNFDNPNGGSNSSDDGDNNHRRGSGDAASVYSTVTTTTAMTESTAAPTLASSRVIYGRGAYVDPEDAELMSLSGRSVVSVNSRGTRGAIPDYNKYRRRRQRRRHPNRDEDADAQEMFNQWATSSGSSDDDSDDSDDDANGLRNGSFASSVARPPEEVLATAGRAPWMSRHQPYPALPDEGRYAPAREEWVVGTEGGMDAVVATARGRHPSAATPTGPPAAATEAAPWPKTSRSRSSSLQRPQHPQSAFSSAGAAPLQPGGNSRRTSNNNNAAASAAAAGAATTAAATSSGPRRKRWTGRDVEMNVAMSGFFASPDTPANYGRSGSEGSPSAPLTPPLISSNNNHNNSSGGASGLPPLAATHGNALPSSSAAATAAPHDADGARAALAAKAAAMEKKYSGASFPGQTGSEMSPSHSSAHRSNSPFGFRDEEEVVNDMDLR